jgi:hypothetical protein
MPTGSTWSEPTWPRPETCELASAAEIGPGEGPCRGTFVGFCGESASGRRCPTPAFALSSLAAAPAPVVLACCPSSCPTMLIKVERPELVCSNLISTSCASRSCCERKSDTTESSAACSNERWPDAVLPTATGENPLKAAPAWSWHSIKSSSDEDGAGSAPADPIIIEARRRPGSVPAVSLLPADPT